MENINLIELKSKYGRIFKAVTPLSKVSVYFKLVSKQECDRYLAMSPDRTTIYPAAEEYIFQAGVVYPSIQTIEEKLFAGEYHAIAEAIANTSGFNVLDVFAKELRTKRLATANLIEQIVGTIAKAFPIYKINEIEAMNYEELTRHLALAEALLEIRLEIPGAEVPELDGEKEEEAPARKGGIFGVGAKPPDLGAMTEEEKATIERQRNHAQEVLRQSRNNRSF